MEEILRAIMTIENFKSLKFADIKWEDFFEGTESQFKQFKKYAPSYGFSNEGYLLSDIPFEYGLKRSDMMVSLLKDLGFYKKNKK